MSTLQIAHLPRIVGGRLMRSHPERDPYVSASVGCGLAALACAPLPATRTLGIPICLMGAVLGMMALGRALATRGRRGLAAWAGLLMAVAAAGGLVAAPSAFGSSAKPRTVATPAVVAVPAPVPDLAAQTAAVLSRDIKVSFGAPGTQLDDTGQVMCFVPVTITNVSGHSAGYDLRFTAIDDKGRQITTDSASIPKLDDNQSAQINVFNIVNSTLVPRLLTAQFRVSQAVTQ